MGETQGRIMGDEREPYTSTPVHRQGYCSGLVEFPHKA